MAPWIQACLFVPVALVARIRGVERRTIARLKDAGANTRERGILLERQGVLNEFVVRRLLRAGVLQEAGNDRYYWQSAAYDSFCRARRRRAFIVFAVVFVIGAALYVRGDLSW